MFDFVSSGIAPGENWRDDHHYAVRVCNGTEEWGQVRIDIGAAWLEMRVAPRQIINLNDEESQVINVINTGSCLLQVEWKKTRD